MKGFKSLLRTFFVLGCMLAIGFSVSLLPPEFWSGQSISSIQPVDTSSAVNAPEFRTANASTATQVLFLDDSKDDLQLTNEIESTSEDTPKASNSLILPPNYPNLKPATSSLDNSASSPKLDPGELEFIQNLRKQTGITALPSGDSEANSELFKSSLSEIVGLPQKSDEPANQPTAPTKNRLNVNSNTDTQSLSFETLTQLLIKQLQNRADHFESAKEYEHSDRIRKLADDLRREARIEIKTTAPATQTPSESLDQTAKTTKNDIFGDIFFPNIKR